MLINRHARQAHEDGRDSRALVGLGPRLGVIRESLPSDVAQSSRENPIKRKQVQSAVQLFYRSEMRRSKRGPRAGVGWAYRDDVLSVMLCSSVVALSQTAGERSGVRVGISWRARVREWFGRESCYSSTKTANAARALWDCRETGGKSIPAQPSPTRTAWLSSRRCWGQARRRGALTVKDPGSRAITSDLLDAAIEFRRDS